MTSDLALIMRSCVLAAATLMLTGCVETGFYETGRVTRAGRFEGGANVALVGSYWDRDTLSFTGATSFGAGGMPPFSAWCRYGLARNLEVGLGAGVSVVALRVKYQFLKGTLDAAAIAELRGTLVFGGDIGTVGPALVPRLVLSSEAPHSFPFEVNAAMMFARWPESWSIDKSVGLSALGGIGVPLHFGDHGQFRVLPELSVGLPLNWTVGPGSFCFPTFILGIDVGYVGAQVGK